MKDSIIKLDSGEHYYIIEDLDYNGHNYILGAYINTSTMQMDEDNFIVQEVMGEGDNQKIVAITDQQTAELITKMLFSKVQETD